MTDLYFVRHAQPAVDWPDDRTRPLTPLGMRDSMELSALFANIPIDMFVSSPYKRSVDTIADCARLFKLEIATDERLRERERGKDANAEGILEKRWSDFSFCEEGGEPLMRVQKRNIEAVKDILGSHANKSIVVGTHGTALSTIMNYYDPSLGCDWFKKIWFCMPYVIRFRYDGQKLTGCEELFSVERGY
ncbi:MAG: histidine phosphatase family protein [Clostridiaceae bacterium]|nr:histidine phosphatase family protein [Eubacteriales bacterium]